MNPHPLTEPLRTAGAEHAGRDRQDAYALRSGVEGTHRQALGATDSRRAHSRGLATTHPEHIHRAVALNLARLRAWWNGKPLDAWGPAHLADAAEVIAVGTAHQQRVLAR